ncbi:unnamed protein product [Owenia fusiformis]|uniref:RCC1-like domain-containing protein n=1 Tax=Owenia fusiformis TaxID=6347 RepID=A0A8J1XYT6_OWEFU|nr:unnamed protein product [Owenia fusiformis]
MAGLKQMSTLVQSVLRTTGNSCNKCGQRHASNLYRREKRKKEKEDSVFQHLGKNYQRTDRVYVWGNATTGALGIRQLHRPEKNRSTVNTVSRPRRLSFLDKYDIKLSDVGTGYGYTVLCGKSPNGPLLMGCGVNLDSQLGYQEYPKNTGRLLDVIIEPVPIELPLIEPSTTRMTQVACGRLHTIVLTDKEGVYTLGNNSYGQCGRPTVEGEVYRGNQIVHKLVTPDSNIKQVVCGLDHTMLLTEGGQVYSFGLNADGQLGSGTYQSEFTPTMVKGDIEGEKIVHIACKADCILAVSAKGDIFGWGNSEYNQLSSVTDKTQVNIPRHLPFKHVGRVQRVCATGSMCGLINESGKVFVWGFGILGKGPKLQQTGTPTEIPMTLFGNNEFNEDVHVKDLQCSLNHFAAITNKGDLYMWGRNIAGALGFGHKQDQFFPMKVAVPCEVSSVHCGVDHTIAVGKAFA